MVSIRYVYLYIYPPPSGSCEWSSVAVPGGGFPFFYPYFRDIYGISESYRHLGKLLTLLWIYDN